jgi:hypothetical protein
MTTYKHKQRLISIEHARDLLIELTTLLTDLNVDRIVGATLVLLLSAVIIVMALFDIELSPLQALHTIFGG